MKPNDEQKKGWAVKMTHYEPRASACKDLTTEDNRTPIVDGMWLYNYYDGCWGKVFFTPYTLEDGWFDHREAGHLDVRGTSLNGVRVSTHDPKGSLPPDLSLKIC